VTDRGVIYLLCGNKHDVMCAVSTMTLRRHWDGPITIFADRHAERIAKWIGRSADASVIRFAPQKHRRNSAYATKPTLPAISPYRLTVQLDADTIVLGPLDALWPENDEGFVLTQFAGWVTTGNRIRKRIEGWAKGVAEDELADSLAAPYPALNTGIMAYGCRSTQAREEWAEMTSRNPAVFISDELAAQICLPKWNDSGLVEVLNDSYNWSPLYHSRPFSEARIVHFHGRKTLHPKAFDIWWPEYQEAVRTNWGRIRRWTPSGDKRLAAYLDGRDPYKEEREAYEAQR